MTVIYAVRCLNNRDWEQAHGWKHRTVVCFLSKSCCQRYVEFVKFHRECMCMHLENILKSMSSIKKQKDQWISSVVISLYPQDKS